MAHNVPPHWKAPTFSFNTQDQVTEWRQFYIRVIDYVEVLDIEPDQEDETKRGWRQIKMMFQGEDRQAYSYSRRSMHTIQSTESHTSYHKR